MATSYVTWLLVAIAGLQLTEAAIADTKVVRMKRNNEQPYDLDFHDADQPGLVRVKRNKREVDSVGDVMEPGLTRVKRDEEELHRFKRTRRDVEQALERFKRTDDEPELNRVKRNKREAKDEVDVEKSADKTKQARAIKASRSNHSPKEHNLEKKGYPAQRMLKREKKTNLNHHWQKHEKRENLKHRLAGRMKKAPHHRADLLANHALRNVHMISKRSKLDKHREKRIPHGIMKRTGRSYDRLEADVAKLGRLRRNIALDLHKANLHDLPHKRAKRTNLTKMNKKFNKKH